MTFIFVFEYNQNLFSYDLPFCTCWSSKYLNFGQKLPNRNPHHTFLESRDPEDTKNPCYVFCSPNGVEKHHFYCQAHGLNTLMLEIFAVEHFCRIYLYDFYPKMAPRDTKELVTFRSITRMLSFYQMETL